MEDKGMTTDEAIVLRGPARRVLGKVESGLLARQMEALHGVLCRELVSKGDAVVVHAHTHDEPAFRPDRLVDLQRHLPVVIANLAAPAADDRLPRLVVDDGSPAGKPHPLTQRWLADEVERKWRGGQGRFAKGFYPIGQPGDGLEADPDMARRRRDALARGDWYRG